MLKTLTGNKQKLVTMYYSMSWIKIGRYERSNQILYQK